METKCTARQKSDAKELIKFIDSLDCPICQASFSDKDSFVILKCHHVLCDECFRDIVDFYKKDKRSNFKCIECNNAYIGLTDVGCFVQVSEDRTCLIDIEDVSEVNNI